MTGQQGADPMAGSGMEVLIALSEIKGQLTTLVAMSGRHDTELRGLDNRVTTLEATRKAATPWWTTVGALVPSVALLLMVAERIYSK